jgi:hypothetical protein
MFSALRSRLRVSPATVIASVALVFAMTGGAYAAKKYLITSTKQISPGVLKALQGKAGVAGAPGVAGAQGAAGPGGPVGPAGKDGANGSNGANGRDGAAGKDGATGKTGATGETGKNGSPWTAGGTLPSEATETGTWWFVGNGQVGTFENPQGGDQYTPLSFPIPLSPADAAAITVHVWNEATPPAERDPKCPGTPDAPAAEPGTLCIYVPAAAKERLSAFVEVRKPDFSGEQGVGTSGGLVYYEGPSAEQHIGGSFAVTAP